MPAKFGLLVYTPICVYPNVIQICLDLPLSRAPRLTWLVPVYHKKVYPTSVASVAACF